MKKSIKSLKICVPIQEKIQQKVLKKLGEIQGKADMAEIWLDHIKDLDIAKLLKNKSLPVICVCKKPKDKGLFKGSYAEMTEILIEAIQCGAEYVDIPFDMPEKLYKKIVHEVRKQPFVILTSAEESLVLPSHSDYEGIPRQARNDKEGIRKPKIIISYHNFIKTPSIKKMLEIAEKMKKRGADIIKIAVMARTLEDTFAVILLAQSASGGQAKKIPHILIAMGEKGILSRVLTPFLGGTIMFAPLTTKDVSASGQLTVKELKKAWGLIRM